MDAEDRLNILVAAKNKSIAEKDTVIESAKADIEDLKKAIEAANIIIQHAEEVKESIAKSVSDEVAVIEELVKFCEGMGDK
jgi:hypothetical protein